jgi:signal peptidase II
MRMEEQKPAPKAKLTFDAKKFFLSWQSFAWMALFFFLFDLISKWVVQTSLKTEGTTVTIIKNFWYVTLTHNNYAAFGGWFGNPSDAGKVAIRIVLILISWAMSAAIAYYWMFKTKREDKMMNAILSLLFAGAFGNLIDRTFYWNGTVGFNGVIDFMEFYLGGGPSMNQNGFNPFAIFNVADACLSVGVVMLVVLILVRDIKKEKGKTAEEQRKEQLGDEPKDTDSHK